MSLLLSLTFEVSFLVSQLTFDVGLYFALMPDVSQWDVRGSMIRHYGITVQSLRVCRPDNLLLVCRVSVKNRRNLS